MSPRAQLADFPANLIDDERLLSQREREIVTTLLRHASNDSGCSAETRASMMQLIERAVGETVAQRAYGLLGSGIVRKLIVEAGKNASCGLSALTVPDVREQSLPHISGQPEHPGFDELRTRTNVTAHLQPQHPGFEDPQARRSVSPPLQPQHPGGLHVEEPIASVAALLGPPKQPESPGFEEPRAGVQPPRLQPEHPGFDDPRRAVASGPRPPSQPQSPGFDEPRNGIAAVASPPLQPQPPRGPQTPSFDIRLEAEMARPGRRLQPEHPGFDDPQIAAPDATSIAVMDAPEPPFRAAQCLVLDEFLVPEEVDVLMRFALAKESDFKTSEVVGARQDRGTVDFEHRRSRVLFNIGEHEDMIVNRIKSTLPRILDRLDMEPFEISRVEAQMTASGDGDFFHQHTDDGEGKVAARELTFVYFFHREPKAFTGGELRIYDSVWKDGYYQAGEKYHSIQPAQNQIVLFPSCLVHEITPLAIPSRAFADSRFTVNGWFRR